MTNFERVQEINKILRENAEKARKENRDFTDAEKAQNESLLREKSWLQLEMQSMEMQREQQKKPVNGLSDFVRDVTNGGKASTMVLRALGANDHSTGSLGVIQPLTIGEVVEKVEEDLIWTLIGIQMPTGLGGQYEWPVVGDLEAEFAGEGATLTPKKLNISKVAAVQQRAGVTAAMTRESVFNSNGRIEDLVRSAMPKAIARAINKVVFTPTQISGCALKGPFVTATKKTVAFTFAGLNTAKADLLALGYDNDSLVWVMSQATKAALECTPKDAGSGIMLVENNMLCGRPIFCCSAIGDKIGLGDFRFQVVGQFGNIDFIVDPYSRAKDGVVEHTLNANYGTATLDEKAFMLLTKSTTA